MSYTWVQLGKERPGALSLVSRILVLEFTGMTGLRVRPAVRVVPLCGTETESSVARATLHYHVQPCHFAQRVLAFALGIVLVL